jgi:hypothetical protein
VARRKRPSDAISTAGRAASPRDATGDTSLQEPLTPKQEYGKAEPTSQPQAAPLEQHFSTGLRDQIADQRLYAQYNALQQYVASNFPGSTLSEQQWLLMNLHHLQNHHPSVIDKIAGVTLSRGVPRESPEFLRTVGQELDRLHVARMQPAPAAPPPMPPMPPMTHIDLEKVESPAGEPESEHMDAHHVSAPVSHGTEHFSGDYEPGEGSRVTLSKAEREHAEAAGVSVEEYGRQKLKMLKLKKAKVIRDE